MWELRPDGQPAPKIDSGRPALYGVKNYTDDPANPTDFEYRDHVMCVVGYFEGFPFGGGSSTEWVIVHDNWGSTGSDVYLQYGTGYDGIYLHPVTPISADSWTASYWNNAELLGTPTWSQLEAARAHVVRVAHLTADDRPLAADLTLFRH